MTRCDAPDCQREDAHSGSQGVPVGGLILARPSNEEVNEPIGCNVCGSPLVLYIESCRAICSCGQRIEFDESGYRQIILPALYPDKMTDPKMLREFGQHQVEQREFFDTLQLRFGLIDQAEFERRRVRDEESLRQFIAVEVTPLEMRKPWWKFW